MTTTPAPARLRAVTREVDPGADLIAAVDGDGFAWLHHKTRIVASGVAARLTPDEVGAALAATEADDPLRLPGTGALAVGALPFDPATPGELVIPARIMGELDGRAWVTEIEPRPSDAAGALPPTVSVVAPRSRAVARHGAGSARRDSNGESEGRAREVMVEADTPFDAATSSAARVAAAWLLRVRIRRLSAQPELLVRRRRSRVATAAGTAAADGDEASLRGGGIGQGSSRAPVRRRRDRRNPEEYCDEPIASLPEVAVPGHVAHPRPARPLVCARAERARHRTPLASGPPSAASAGCHRRNPRSVVSIAVATPGRSVGSATAVGDCTGAEPTVPARLSRAPGSRPDPADAEWARPGGSSRCCGPSSGLDLRRRGASRSTPVRANRAARSNASRSATVVSWYSSTKRPTISSHWSSRVARSGSGCCGSPACCRAPARSSTTGSWPSSATATSGSSSCATCPTR